MLNKAGVFPITIVSVCRINTDEVILLIALSTALII